MHPPPQHVLETNGRLPAEWEPHEAVWMAWPCDPELWGDALPAAQREWADLVRAIGGSGRGAERVRVLLPDGAREAEVRAALSGSAPGMEVDFVAMPYGDIWLRDTAPVFLLGRDRRLSAACFVFNGWGGKYVLDGDAEVAGRIARRAGAAARFFPWVLEGGAVESDGDGTLLTTRTCLHHENRNPQMDHQAIDAALRQAFGAATVGWLDGALVNDHTDGHIDTLVRFWAPGQVLAMTPESPDDPNRDVLLALRHQLERLEDARGRRLAVRVLPSPGRVTAPDGEIMPASYLNFFIANRTVVVPTYGRPNDERAVSIIAQCFPDRRVVGRSALHLLRGGGAFHCVTAPQPASRPAAMESRP